MKYRVIDKEAPIPAPRTGQAAELYKDLVVLMEDAPGKKLLVDFDNTQAGYRAVLRMLDWAAEDGFTLFQRVVKGSASRSLFLQRNEEVSA